MVKWLSVRLCTKWLWVRVQLQSHNDAKLCFTDDENFLHVEFQRLIYELPIVKPTVGPDPNAVMRMQLFNEYKFPL